MNVFHRKNKVRTQARMVRVCERCYIGADVLDRILMTMVQDSECEMEHK